MKRILTSLGAVVLLALVVVVGVRADAPATTFYACVNNSSGAIHLVSAGTTCAMGERFISWNQTGPQGPAGPQGPQGSAGANGVSGYQIVSQTIALPPVSSSQQLQLSVECPTGLHSIGGGYVASANNGQIPDIRVGVGSGSFGPSIDGPIGADGIAGDGWTVAYPTGYGVSSGAASAGLNPTFTVYAICASVG